MGKGKHFAASPISLASAAQYLLTTRRVRIPSDNLMSLHWLEIKASLILTTVWRFRAVRILSIFTVDAWVGTCHVSHKDEEGKGMKTKL